MIFVCCFLVSDTMRTSPITSSSPSTLLSQLRPFDFRATSLSRIAWVLVCWSSPLSEQLRQRHDDEIVGHSILETARSLLSFYHFHAVAFCHSAWHRHKHIHDVKVSLASEFEIDHITCSIPRIEESAASRQCSASHAHCSASPFSSCLLSRRQPKSRRSSTIRRKARSPGNSHFHILSY